MGSALHSSSGSNWRLRTAWCSCDVNQDPKWKSQLISPWRFKIFASRFEHRPFFSAKAHDGHPNTFSVPLDYSVSHQSLPTQTPGGNANQFPPVGETVQAAYHAQGVIRAMSNDSLMTSLMSFGRTDLRSSLSRAIIVIVPPGILYRPYPPTEVLGIRRSGRQKCQINIVEYSPFKKNTERWGPVAASAPAHAAQSLRDRAVIAFTAALRSSLWRTPCSDGPAVLADWLSVLRTDS